MRAASIEYLEGFEGHSSTLAVAAAAAPAEAITPAPLGPSSALVAAVAQRLNVRLRLLSASFRAEAVYSPGAGLAVAGGDCSEEDLSVLIMSADPVAPNKGEPSPSLAFWRHDKTGAVLADRLISLEERLRLSSWTLQGLAELLPDRVILTPAAAFVSLWPASVELGETIQRKPALIWAAYVLRV